MRLLLAAILLLPAGSGLAADGAWRQLKTEHYVVLSQLSEPATANWVRQYDQFIASTSTMLTIDLKALPPLTVLLFSRDRDFVPYKLPRPDGKTSNVAGQFIRRPTWSVIGLAEDTEDEYTRHIIFHEGAHWLMSVDPTRQPPWFSEGIAELFSTFERRPTTVNWAKPIPAHLQLLNQGATIPFQEFLSQDTALSNRGDHTGRFYAQSWAFVHFLLVSSDPARRQLLLKYLSTFRTNSAEATFEATFGPGLSDMERAFQLYIRQKSFGYISKPVIPVPTPPPMTAARPADVEIALAFLSLGANKAELTQKHIAKALELDPTLPGPHEVLAYLAADERELDKAATHAEAALHNGSKDAEMFMTMGDSYRFGANANRPNADLNRVRMYENAINMNPRRLPAYERLTEALFDIEAPTAEDAKFLDLGVKAFPDVDWIKVGVAAVAFRRNQRDAAFAVIDQALRSNGTLDGSQRQFATHLRSSWIVKEMYSEVQAAMDKKDYAAALRNIESRRSLVAGDPSAEEQMKELQSSVETMEAINRAMIARQAGRKAEATAILDGVLRRPDLPPELRRHVEQVRGK